MEGEGGGKREGGGRDRKEDVEKKEGEMMAIYSSGFRGCKKHTLPIFLHKHTSFLYACYKI